MTNFFRLLIFVLATFCSAPSIACQPTPPPDLITPDIALLAKAAEISFIAVVEKVENHQIYFRVLKSIVKSKEGEKYAVPINWRGFRCGILRTGEVWLYWYKRPAPEKLGNDKTEDFGALIQRPDGYYNQYSAEVLNNVLGIQFP
jgi:hypothetical protein